MFAGLYNLLFGCIHRKTTFPFSLRGNKSAKRRATQFETYVVCLDCGRELPYSWDEMRIVPAGVSEGTGRVRQPEGFPYLLK